MGIKLLWTQFIMGVYWPQCCQLLIYFVFNAYWISCYLKCGSNCLVLYTEVMISSEITACSSVSLFISTSFEVYFWVQRQNWASPLWRLSLLLSNFCQSQVWRLLSSAVSISSYTPFDWVSVNRSLNKVSVSVFLQFFLPSHHWIGQKSHRLIKGALTLYLLH